MKVLLGLKRFDVLGLAGTFLKMEEVSVTGYEWHGRNRGGGKWSSGGVAVLVHMSLESRVRKSREGLVWVELSGVRRKMVVEVVYVHPEGVRDGEAV